MRELTLKAAQTIVAEALSYSRKHDFEPLTVVVLDDRGTVKAVASEDGSSLSRFDIARGKAFACLAFGLGARAVGKKAPHFVSAVGQLTGVNMVPVAGGVLMMTSDKTVAGAVGISGDTPTMTRKPPSPASRRRAWSRRPGRRDSASFDKRRCTGSSFANARAIALEEALILRRERSEPRRTRAEALQLF